MVEFRIEEKLRFQFLIGRLITAKSIKAKKNQRKVSIPHR
jgi:hypothetical protein